MSTHSEEILHHAVHGHEPLHVSGRLEAPHLALALPGRLVGDFGAIVRVLVRAVNHRRHHGAERGVCAVGCWWCERIPLQRRLRHIRHTAEVTRAIWAITYCTITS